LFTVSRRLALKHEADYYTERRDFPIFVSRVSLTGHLRTRNGVTSTLSACDPDFAAKLSQQHYRVLSRSLSEIADASLRFYQDGEESPFAAVEYRRAHFLLLHDWDHVFGKTDRNSIGQLSRELSGRHGEAIIKSTEMFGYGLAIQAAAAVLDGLPLLRFRFLDSSGKRPDFSVNITPEDLIEDSSMVEILLAAGDRAFLEVKTRSISTQKETHTFPIGLLYDLQEKASAWADRTGQTGRQLGVYVGIPDRGRALQGRTKIVLSDPGRSKTMNEAQQAEFILREVLVLALRYGLWQTSQSALTWIKELGADLTENEQELLLRSRPDDKYVTESRLAQGKTFRGRVFSETLYLLNRTGKRGMTKDEARERLQLQDYGPNYFCGIDETMQDIIEQRDVAGLLSYGTTRQREAALTMTAPSLDQPFADSSAFIQLEEELRPGEAEEIKNSLERALSRW